MTAQPTCDVLNKEKTLLDWANEGYAWGEFTVDNGKGGRCWTYQSLETKRKMNEPAVRALGMEWYNVMCIFSFVFSCFHFGFLQG